MIRTCWFVTVLLLTSCAQEPLKTYSLSVPEAEQRSELDYIQARLLAEQQILPDNMTFYEAITVSLDPEPSLHITVHSRHLAKQNLIQRLHQWGYTVEGRPGDPARRAAFLVEGL